MSVIRNPKKEPGVEIYSEKSQSLHRKRIAKKQLLNFFFNFLFLFFITTLIFVICVLYLPRFFSSLGASLPFTLFSLSRVSLSRSSIQFETREKRAVFYRVYLTKILPLLELPPFSFISSPPDLSLSLLICQIGCVQ